MTTDPRATTHCPEPSRPVTCAGIKFGEDAERTDEKSLRLWCTQAAERLGGGAYALKLRSYDYAKEFIRANNGVAPRIQTIQEAY